MATVPGAFNGNTLHFEGEVRFETLILALFWHAPRHLVHLAILICALAGCVVLYAITLAWWQLCWWQSMLLLKTAELMKKAYVDENGVTTRELTTELPTKMATRTYTRPAVLEIQSKAADASQSKYDLSTKSVSHSEKAVSHPGVAEEDADAVAAYELACEGWEPDTDDVDDYRTSEHAQTPKSIKPKVDEDSRIESQATHHTFSEQKPFDQLLDAPSEEAVRATAQSAWVQKLRTGVDPSSRHTTVTGSAGRQRAQVSSVLVKESMHQHLSPTVDHTNDTHDVDTERIINTRPLATSSLNDSDADRKARQLALLECRAFLQTATKPGQKVRPPYDESLTHEPRSSASTLPKARIPLPKVPSTPARGRPAFAPAPKGHSGPWATVAASSLKQPSPRALEAAKVQAQSRIPPPPGFIPPHTRAANAAKAARIQILQTRKAAQSSADIKTTAPAPLEIESDQMNKETPTEGAEMSQTTPAERPSPQAFNALGSNMRDEPCLVLNGDLVRDVTSLTKGCSDGSTTGEKASRANARGSPLAMISREEAASDRVVRFSIDHLRSCSPPKTSGGISCSRCDRLATHLVQMVEEDRQPLCFPCFTVDDRIDDAVDVITGDEDILGGLVMVPTDLNGFSIARKKAHSSSTAVPKGAVPSESKTIASHGHSTSPVLRAATPASVEEVTGSEWQVAASRQTKLKNKKTIRAHPRCNKNEHVDEVAYNALQNPKIEGVGEINGILQHSSSKHDGRSASLKSNGSASASSTMSASALPFASFPRGRETSPMSRHFWVPPAPNTLQTAARLALSPPIHLQSVQPVELFGPASPPQPCSQLERQIALFGQSAFAHQIPEMPLEQPIMPSFGPPPLNGMLFHTSPHAHHIPLFAPPGLASAPVYEHADFEDLDVYDNHIPAAPPNDFQHGHFLTYPAHATYQTTSMPTPLPALIPQSQRRDSSRSASKAVPIMMPAMATQAERKSSAPNAPEAAMASVPPEQKIEALKVMSDLDEDLAMSRLSAADVPASQSETKESLTKPTVLDVEDQSAHDHWLGRSGLAFANDTVAIALTDDNTGVTEPTTLAEDVVEKDVTTAMSANKLARNRSKAKREALTAAWYTRETFRVKLNGSYSLDRAQAFTTATKEYNANRKELAASMSSGELNEEDATTFPFLSPKDTTVPKVRPKALTASAATTAPPANVPQQSTDKENNSAPHPSCVDPTCTTCSEHIYKIALTKTIHALETLIKARRMSSQRCKKCQDHFCLGGTPSKSNPKLHAATEYYRRSRNKLVEVSGGSLREEIGYKLPDPHGGCEK
ncbi:hypothetical protein B0A48_08832 [Cryoendolithus antarcticus]|uniref:Transmembrane protein n=1 Tax=Cryoendolithus antarcticus TaxID=1507870 RepID=A0A1V8T4M3_9PEZI|nr:hypothetical protein B0A48_08832 [Cryoendolithus antarcticus]